MPVVDPELDVFSAIADSARAQANGRWKLPALAKPPSSRPAQYAQQVEIPLRQEIPLIQNSFVPHDHVSLILDITTNRRRARARISDTRVAGAIRAVVDDVHAYCRAR